MGDAPNEREEDPMADREVDHIALRVQFTPILLASRLRGLEAELQRHGWHRLLSQEQARQGDWQLDQPLQPPTGEPLAGQGALQRLRHTLPLFAADTGLSTAHNGFVLVSAALVLLMCGWASAPARPRAPTITSPPGAPGSSWPLHCNRWRLNQRCTAPAPLIRSHPPDT
jgi:hypothetical protein